MRIAVFGATGGIGRHVVAHALADGHEVVAYARTPTKLAVEDARLEVVRGELSDVAAVRHAIDGSDAVISALGPAMSPLARGLPLVDGTRAIVGAMEAAGVRRYLGIGTPSVADPRDRPTATSRIAPLIARTLLPRAYRELVGMTAVVTESTLDWTVARFLRPTDGPPGAIRSGFVGGDPVGAAIPRVDIARFLVDEVDSPRYVRALPVVGS